MRLLTRMIAVALETILAAGSWPPSMAKASTEGRMAENAVPAFASSADAEAFLSDALPAATAANPKYRTPGHRLRQALADQDDHVLASRGRRRHRVERTKTSRTIATAPLVSRGSAPSQIRNRRRHDLPRNDRRRVRKRRKGAGRSCSNASALLASTPSGTENHRSAPGPTSISRTPISAIESCPRFRRCRRGGRLARRVADGL